MSMARHTSKSVTAMAWEHTVRSGPTGLVCEAWNQHGDTIEVTGATDFELRVAALNAIELVDAERKAGCSLV